MFKRFLKCKSGTTSIEYGLIALLVGASLVGAIGNLGQENAITYDGISNEVVHATK